jgi:RNA polymerase sigma-70 factor (ECF subfamily)
MRRFSWLAWGSVAAGVLCAVLLAQEKPPKAAEEWPPRVVATEPADRASDVDPDLAEIRVTFDRPMTVGENYSWVKLVEWGQFPGSRGARAPRWENGGRTCVLAVKLEPGVLYAVGINSFRHRGFRDTVGTPAVPFAWVFRTKKE